MKEAFNNDSWQAVSDSRWRMWPFNREDWGVSSFSISLFWYQKLILLVILYSIWLFLSFIYIYLEEKRISYLDKLIGRKWDRKVFFFKYIKFFFSPSNLIFYYTIFFIVICKIEYLIYCSSTLVVMRSTLVVSYFCISAFS